MWILGAKNIILNYKHNWYIRNKIISEKIKITLMPPSLVNSKNKNSLCINIATEFFFEPIVIKTYKKIKFFKKRN